MFALSRLFRSLNGRLLQCVGALGPPSSCCSSVCILRGPKGKVAAGGLGLGSRRPAAKH